MIKNEKQYKISRKKLQDLYEQMEALNKDTKNPLRNDLLKASLLSAASEIESDILVYDSLKSSKNLILKERVIKELPSLLTEYKIKSGYTQKEFSEKLGVKEQQLQRYEADDFKSVTFKNLLRFFEAVGLEIKIKETRLNKSRQKTQKKKKSSSH